MMPNREKYIEVLSQIVKTAEKFNDYAPIEISLVCVKDIFALLKEQEAVVRCKDCRWGEPAKNYYGEDRIICGNDDTYIDRYITVPQDWFCADGERKEDR